MADLEAQRERVRAASDIVAVIRESVELKQRGQEWWAPCPFHQEDTASFHVRPKEGFWKCFGCGESGDVFDFVMKVRGVEFPEALKLLAARAGMELESPPAGSDRSVPRPAGRAPAPPSSSSTAKEQERPVTVSRLAAAKGLAPGDLEGSYDASGAVQIPYYLADGSRAPRTRIRRALEAGKGSKWTGSARDGAIVPYGLHRLAAARESGYLVLVEGESDCWSLWSQGFPALGIPGAAMVGKLEAAHVAGFERVYVVREPDRGGETFVAGVAARLAEVGFAGKALMVSCDPVKDPNELLRTTDDFKAAFEQMLAEARPLPKPGAADACGGKVPPKLLAVTTDAGNGELFAHLYGDRVRFDHRRGHWLVWGGHWWAAESNGEVTRLAKAAARVRYRGAVVLPDDKRAYVAKWAIKSESRQKLEAAMALARCEPPIADAGDGWDADPWLLGVGNGVVDLRSGELRPGEPEDMVTLGTDVPLVAGAKCERWLAFLGEIFGGDAELVEFIRRAAGYSLTGNVGEQCWFLLHGQGANGKSTFLRTLRGVWGDHAANTPFSTFELAMRSTIPNDLASLAGRRLVTATETVPGRRLDEARVKALTGGDPITARFLHSEFFTFEPVGKLWLGVNHRPRVQDDSTAFWRRMRVIPFEQEFLGEADDKDLPETLMAEGPGILAWAIAGCLAWQRDGLGLPEQVAAAVVDYSEESDPIGEFLAACCVEVEGAKTSMPDLRRAYTAWADEQGITARERLGGRALGRCLAGRFKRCWKGRSRAYEGIGLAATWMGDNGTNVG